MSDMARDQAITLAVIGAAVATITVGAPTAAQATTGQLSVTTVAAPVWTAGEAIPISITVRNRDAQLFCDPVTVSTTWATTGARRTTTMAAPTTAGVFAGATMIPARAEGSGIVRYKVRASQTCGLLNRTSTYVGRTGWHYVKVA